MRRKSLTVVAAAVLGGVLTAGPAFADSMFSLYIGSYTPHADAASRGVDDFLVMSQGFGERLDLNAFKHFIVGFDGINRAGEHVEISLGAGYYNQSVNGSYGGAPIINKLTLVPANVAARYLPLGLDGRVHPYLGGGVAVSYWRLGYEDFAGAENSMGIAVGPLFVLGVRAPIGDSSVSIGGEMRWQGGHGTTPTDSFFNGAKLDVGGRTLMLTMNFGR
jgi:outer membrane protein W